MTTRCARCHGEAALETFGVFACPRCGRLDADGQPIVPAPAAGGFAPPPAHGEPVALVGAPSGVPARTIGWLVALAVLVWVGAHLWANTRDEVLDREELTFIAMRTLVLPLVALFYRTRTTMSGSGWFLTVVVLGGMLASVLPGLERWSAAIILSSALAFLDRRQRDRDWGRRP